MRKSPFVAMSLLLSGAAHSVGANPALSAKEFCETLPSSADPLNPIKGLQQVRGTALRKLIVGSVMDTPYVASFGIAAHILEAMEALIAPSIAERSEALTGSRVRPSARRQTAGKRRHSRFTGAATVSSLLISPTITTATKSGTIACHSIVP